MQPRGSGGACPIFRARFNRGDAGTGFQPRYADLVGIWEVFPVAEGSMVGRPFGG
jgi:hypothetical protein